MKISDSYREVGVEEFYRKEGDRYSNPHEIMVRKLLEKSLPTMNLPSGHVLDLACGSGEVTLVMERFGLSMIDAIDPYTYKAFKERTGREAERFTFEQIADGCLSGRRYDLIVCSFALHLVDESRLPILCYQLSTISDQLIVITPIKRPDVKSAWGWSLESEEIISRVKSRIYRSTNVIRPKIEVHTADPGPEGFAVRHSREEIEKIFEMF